MAQKTDSQLGVLAQQVADETAPGANTADRVGNLFQDFVDSKVNNAALPLRYAAKVTQSSTGAPSATIAENTTGKTITWARSSGGYSTATANAACFTSGKTIVRYSGTGAGGYTDPKLFSHALASTTVINFGSFRASDQTAEDDWSMDVEILIFP